MTGTSEDHVAILNLLARYNHAIDLGNSEDWADCFTDDGVFDARPVTHSKGRKELIAFCEQSLGRTRHWTTNPLVKVNGDTATLDLYLMTVTPGAQDAPFATPGVTGVYHDQLVKVDGEWKIKFRKLDFDAPPPGYE